MQLRASLIPSQPPPKVFSFPSLRMMSLHSGCDRPSVCLVGQVSDSRARPGRVPSGLTEAETGKQTLPHPQASPAESQGSGGAHTAGTHRAPSVPAAPHALAPKRSLRARPLPELCLT